MFSSKYLFFESQDCPWAFSSYYATSDSVPLFILSPLQCIALLRPCILLLAFSLNIVTISITITISISPGSPKLARPPTGSKISKISETLQHKSMHQQICWKDNKGHPYQSDIRLHVYSSGLCSGLFLLEAIFLGSRVL